MLGDRGLQRPRRDHLRHVTISATGRRGEAARGARPRGSAAGWPTAGVDRDRRGRPVAAHRLGVRARPRPDHLGPAPRAATDVPDADPSSVAHRGERLRTAPARPPRRAPDGPGEPAPTARPRAVPVRRTGTCTAPALDPQRPRPGATPGRHRARGGQQGLAARAAARPARERVRVELAEHVVEEQHGLAPTISVHTSVRRRAATPARASLLTLGRVGSASSPSIASRSSSRCGPTSVTPRSLLLRRRAASAARAPRRRRRRRALRATRPRSVARRGVAAGELAVRLVDDAAQPFDQAQPAPHQLGARSAPAARRTRRASPIASASSRPPAANSALRCRSTRSKSAARAS